MKNAITPYVPVPTITLPEKRVQFLEKTKLFTETYRDSKSRIPRESFNIEYEHVLYLKEKKAKAIDIMNKLFFEYNVPRFAPSLRDLYFYYPKRDTDITFESIIDFIRDLPRSQKYFYAEDFDVLTFHICTVYTVSEKIIALIDNKSITTDDEQYKFYDTDFKKELVERDKEHRDYIRDFFKWVFKDITAEDYDVSMDKFIGKLLNDLPDFEKKIREVQ